MLYIKSLLLFELELFKKIFIRFDHKHNYKFTFKKDEANKNLMIVLLSALDKSL